MSSLCLAPIETCPPLPWYAAPLATRRAQDEVERKGFGSLETGDPPILFLDPCMHGTPSSSRSPSIDPTHFPVAAPESPYRCHNPPSLLQRFLIGQTQTNPRALFTSVNFYSSHWLHQVAFLPTDWSRIGGMAFSAYPPFCSLLPHGFTFPGP